MPTVISGLRMGVCCNVWAGLSLNFDVHSGLLTDLLIIVVIIWRFFHKFIVIHKFLSTSDQRKKVDILHLLSWCV